MQTFQQPVAQQPVYTQQPAAVREEKSAGAALLLSFLLPGSGQVYNGETGKGIGIFLGTILGTIIGAFILFIPGIIVWLYGIYDAYTTAQKMNTGKIPYKPTSVGVLIVFIIVEIVLVVIMISAVIAAFVFGTGSQIVY